MKKIPYLIVAIIGNGLGSAIMFRTHVGMSAWGTSAANVSYALDITPGMAFIVVSVVFYVVSIVIRKRFVPLEMLLSMLFLLGFSGVLDFFVGVLPDFGVMRLFIRVAINFGGLLILMFSIALHIKVNLAVHPMDVFLKTMQEDVFKNVARGTYVAYGCAFLVAIVFGLIDGEIHDVGIGTVMTLMLGGAIMGFYDRTILKSFGKEQNHVSD